MTQSYRFDRLGAEISSEPVDPDNAHRGAVGTLAAHDSFRHDGFLWSGEDEFLSGTVPFILEGLGAGQPVMVAVIAARIELLRAAMGTSADRVRFVDMAVLGRNPAQIIPTWREFVAEHAADGQPVRGIGEPIWASRRPAEVSECQLHEALLNVAVEPHTPLWLMCPYDVQALAPDVITEAQRSHPVLLEDQNRRGSTLYGGARHVMTIFEAGLPPVMVAAWSRTFGREDLAALRADVTNHALAAGLSPPRSADLALAVHEVASNSVKHGSGKRVLSAWIEHDSLVRDQRPRSDHRSDDRPHDAGKGRREGAWALDGQPALRSGSGPLRACGDHDPYPQLAVRADTGTIHADSLSAAGIQTLRTMGRLRRHVSHNPQAGSSETAEG